MRASLVAAGLGLFLVGCAQVPKPAAYPLSYQQKMQAARHWELLAQNIADRVVAEQGTVSSGGIYVEPVGGVFGEAFTTLLKTDLANNGATLAPAAKGAAVLSADVQLISYRAKAPHRYNRRNPGFWTAVATVVRLADNMTANMIIPAGLAADLVDGSYTTLTKNEVLITTSLDKDGQCLMRQSDIFYVNDADRGQYADAKAGKASGGAGAGTKTLEVVAK